MSIDKKDDRKLYILSFSSILLFLAIFLIIYSFFSNFGITDDEGFYLYFLVHGISENTFTFFHTFLHFVGKIFNHNLIGYRILNLLLIIGSINFAAYGSYLFYFSDKKSNHKIPIDLFIFLSLINIASLGFFSFIPTFSYTSSAIISVNLWIGSIFYYYNEKEANKFKIILFITFSIFFALMSRIHFALALYILTPLSIYLISYRLRLNSNRFLFKLIIVILSFTLFFIIIHSNFIRKVIPLIGVLELGSHKSLLSLYKNQIIEFLVHKDFYIIYQSILILLIYLGLKKIHIILTKFGAYKSRFFLNINSTLKKFLTFRFEYFLIIIIVLILLDYRGFYKHLFVINGTPSDASHRISRYTLALIAFTPVFFYIFNFLKCKLFEESKSTENFLKDKFFIVYLVCILPSLFSGLGTGSNIILWSTFSLGAFSIPLGILLINLTDSFNKNARYFILVISIIFLAMMQIIIREQIYQYRRNTLYTEQSHYSSKSPHLGLVKIDSYSAESIDKLITTLNEIGFNYEVDRIFVYPDLPGLLSSTKAKSFGDVWNQFPSKNFRELKDSEVKICSYINLEEQNGIRNIYLLLGNELSENLKNCLNSKIKLNKPSYEFQIGKLKNIAMVYNGFSESIIKIKLVGPFKFK